MAEHREADERLQGKSCGECKALLEAMEGFQGFLTQRALPLVEKDGFFKGLDSL